MNVNDLGGQISIRGVPPERVYIQHLNIDSSFVQFL